jgi:hypothetical protein
MKNILAATALSASLIAGQAFAGGMAEPIMEEEIVVEEATSSSRAGILVPILALILIGCAIACNRGGDEPQRGIMGMEGS